MVGFLKSLFGGSSAPDNPTPPLLPIEEMSFEQILAHICTLGDAIPPSHAIRLVKRLYEIAFFDHHVPMEQRERAVLLLDSVKAGVETALADKPDAIEAFRNANSDMENNVRHFGVGSLAWMIKEHDVPTDEFFPYVMRPEHGHLLADLLEALGPTAVENMKPQLVRHLILSRRYNNTSNAVLMLHGLAAKGDKATGAIFTTEECAALLGVPDDYSAGRKILVNLGLLPGNSNARPFNSALDKESLVGLMAFVHKDRDALAKTDPRLEHLPEEHRTVALVALSMLRIHLTCRFLRQIYGSEMSAAYLAIHSRDSVKQTLEMFNQVADNLAVIYPPPPIDFMLFDQVMKLGGLAPETDEDFEYERKWMDMGAEWLNHERVELQADLRLSLRWKSDDAPLEIRSVADEEITNFINKTYMRKGAQAGIAERAMAYYEDWIGTDA